MNDTDAIRIQQLKAENKELDHLFSELENEQHFILSGVSHELRNILALVLSSLQLIESSHPEAKDFHYWNETMCDLQYMKKLLSNFSDFNNGKKLDRSSISLYGLLESLHRSMLPFFQEHGQNLLFMDSGPRPILSLDATKLKQAVINLLKNACEASEEGKEVVLYYRCCTDKVTISVNDSGSGMTPEQCEKLFQPFATTKATGTGMGLPLARKIAEGHGGSLQVTSIPGQGTSCTMAFPLSALACDTESSPA